MNNLTINIIIFEYNPTPMTRLLSGIIIIVLSGGLLHCTVLKKEDSEDAIRLYLSGFRQSLLSSDDEILSHFRVSQSRDAVLAVINILQNKDPFIVCEADINNALISKTNELIIADIPVRLSVKELNSQDQERYSLRIGLAREGDDYKIVRLDGEEFYMVFNRIKNKNKWEAEQALALKSRAWAYKKASELETQFDTVVWFTTYCDKNYFYVVEGPWVHTVLNEDTRNQQVEGIKMGLVDSLGEIIIPITYDLVGTIGFEKADLVEVKQGDKVGYFNIEQRQLIVPVVYDQIIPYDSDHAFALVKQDTSLGWIDKQFNYHPGFASDSMEDWYNNFEYLRKSILLQAGRYAFAEIPREDFVASGIIIPPAYLSTYGVLEVIENGFSLTDAPVNAYTESKQTTNSLIENITNTLRAVVITIREHYLEGREEFYE